MVYDSGRYQDIYVRCTAGKSYECVAMDTSRTDCSNHDNRTESGTCMHDTIGNLTVFGKVWYISYFIDSVEWSPEINEQDTSYSLDEKCYICFWDLEYVADIY